MLRPFVNCHQLLRVGGRQNLPLVSYDRRHPIILPGDSLLTKPIIRGEHLRLLHAGPTFVAASLARRFHILGGHRAVHTVTRSCIVCRRVIGKPRPQLLGQLPPDRINLGPVFNRVGVEYGGPLLVNSGPTRRPLVTNT